MLGADAVIRSGTVVYLGSRIGARFQAGHNVVIREECEIGDDVSVWSNSVIDYGCRIGDRVKIHSNCYVAQFSEIADGAFLAPGVTFANDLYPGQASSAAVMSGPSIGAGAQIGVNVTILPFVGSALDALSGRAPSSSATFRTERWRSATPPRYGERSAAFWRSKTGWTPWPRR